jgi:hypothetical protein
LVITTRYVTGTPTDAKRGRIRRAVNRPRNTRLEAAERITSASTRVKTW